MVNPFLSNPRERLNAWRNLRACCDESTDDTTYLGMVVRYWSQAPIRSQFFDYTDPSSWPDGWMLIDSGDYDHNSIGLGMFYTLLLSGDRRWRDRLQLKYLRHLDDHNERLVTVVDQSWVLNYNHGMISAWPLHGNILVLHRFAWDEVSRGIIEL